MPRKKVKPIKYPNVDSFPEGHISANMIQNSYVGVSAQYVRRAVMEGKLAGSIVGTHCYMTKAQVIKNWG